MDEISKEENRRSVLKKAGSVGIGLAGIASSSAASPLNGRATPKVDSASSVEKKQAIRSMSSDDQVMKLLQYFKRDGCQPDFEDGRYIKVKPAEEPSYVAAAVPIETQKSAKENPETYLKWGGSQRVQPSTHTIKQRSEDIVEQFQYVNNGEVESKSTKITEEISTKSPPEYTDPGSGSCGSFDNQYCINFNLSCLAIAVAGLGISCLKGLVGCLIGLSLEAIAVFTGDQCSLCDEYHTEVISQCRY